MNSRKLTPRNVSESVYEKSPLMDGYIKSSLCVCEGVLVQVGLCRVAPFLSFFSFALVYLINLFCFSGSWFLTKDSWWSLTVPIISWLNKGFSTAWRRTLD